MFSIIFEDAFSFLSKFKEFTELPTRIIADSVDYDLLCIITN